MTPAAGTSGTAIPQLKITQSFDLQNPTPMALDLTGWKLRIGTTSVSFPSNSRIGPNETAVIHLGPGTSSGNDIYLGQEGQALASALKPGARITLEGPNGQMIAEFALPA